MRLLHLLKLVAAIALAIQCYSTSIVSAAPVMPPSTECSLVTSPTSSDIKTLSCMLEKEIFDLLKDTSLPTMHPDEMEDCNCQDKSNRFKYTSSPTYGVAPHIRIDHLYKSYQAYRYPENTVDLDGNSVPVTTEWILKDYINSLKGFVNYFTSSPLTGLTLEKIVWELNATVLSRFNAFSFSSDCPSNEKVANFSSLTNATCEIKCATLHFNDTVKGLNNALANQEIYKTKTSKNKLPGINTWTSMECCPLLEQAHVMSPIDYRNLTCNVQSLYYDAHILFQQLGQQATTQCDGVTTVTGIKTWRGYYNDSGSFPPVQACSFSEKLYIYGGHFGGLEKYDSDLSLLVQDTTFYCFSPTAQNTILAIKDRLEATLPLTTHWMRAHGCPSCANSCSPPETEQLVSPYSVNSPIHLHEACPEMYKELSCLAYDMRSIATSLYMFLELRDEAQDSWKYDCTV